MRLDEIRAEWSRAQKALRAADVLLTAGLREDAISRAYYAVLHAAKAGLLVVDVPAESHAAVRRMFGLSLVKPGHVESEWAEVLADTQDERETADYDVQSHAAFQHADGVVQQARRFVERMSKLLADSGVGAERE